MIQIDPVTANLSFRRYARPRMIPRLDPLYFRLRYLRFDESRKASVIIEMKLHRWAAVHFPPADMFFFILFGQCLTLLVK